MFALLRRHRATRQVLPAVRRGPRSARLVGLHSSRAYGIQLRLRQRP